MLKSLLKGALVIKIRKVYLSRGKHYVTKTISIDDFEVLKETILPW
ncbi:MAG: hypothetical protein V3U92_11975 [Cellulophaga sp.]